MTFGTACYIERIVAREGYPSVMAHQTIVGGLRQMLTYRNVCHLSALRGTVDDIVAVAAANAAMISVSKYPPKTVSRHRCSPIRGKLMTYTAAGYFTVRRVASVAVVVGIDARRDRLSGPRRRMAKC